MQYNHLSGQERAKLCGSPEFERDRARQYADLNAKAAKASNRPRYMAYLSSRAARFLACVFRSRRSLATQSVSWLSAHPCLQSMLVHVLDRNHSCSQRQGRYAVLVAGPIGMARFVG